MESHQSLDAVDAMIRTFPHAVLLRTIAGSNPNDIAQKNQSAAKKLILERLLEVEQKALNMPAPYNIQEAKDWKKESKEKTKGCK